MKKINNRTINKKMKNVENMIKSKIMKIKENNGISKKCIRRKEDKKSNDQKTKKKKE